MFGDTSSQDGTSSSSDGGLSALLTAYGQSITDAGNKAIQVAEDRIKAAGAAAGGTTATSATTATTAT